MDSLKKLIERAGMVRQSDEPLLLGVKRKPWRIKGDPATEEADRRFRAAKKALKETGGRKACLFCKWPGKLEVHHLNDDHDDNRPENLASICSLCHQCFHVGLAGAQGRGIIIWAPEWTQTQVNIMGRVIITMIHGEPWSDYRIEAESIYYDLVNRSEAVRKMLGHEWMDPSWLGNLMLNMSNADYARRREILWPLRLMPSADGFQKQIDEWTEIMSGMLTPEVWMRMAAGH